MVVQFTKRVINEYKAERSWYRFVEGDVPRGMWPSRFRSAINAFTIILHERLAEATCRIFGHDMEKEDNYPFMICRRCLHEEEV